MSIDVNTAMVDYTLLYRIVDDIVDRRPAQSASGPDLISLLLAARDPETGVPMSRRFEADAEQAHPDMPTSRSQVAFAAALVATSP